MDSKELQKNVFKKILSNTKTLPAYLNKISPKDFTNALAHEVIDALQSSGQSIQTAPTKEYYEILLRERIRDKEQLSAACGMLSKMAEKPQPQDDLDMLIKELKRERMCGELTQIIKTAAGRITPADIDRTYEDMMKELLRLPMTGSDSAAQGVMKEVFEDAPDRIEAYFRASNRKFPCGIKAFDKHIGGFAPGELIVLTAATGAGKSLAPGTKVIRYSGEIANVEDIRTGDILMGPDSKPRRVLGTSNGTDEMYRIVPVNGEPWVCNSPHILTLIHTVTGEIIDIGLQDYISKSKKFKHLYKQFFVGVDFPVQSKELPIDPYFLGVWYGDGTKSLRCVQITKPDREIQYCVASMAAERGLKMSIDTRKSIPMSYRIVKQNGSQRNSLLDDIRQVVGVCDKIPHEYLTSSRENRAALLAGLLDTDGYLNYTGFEIVQKRKCLADGICFLARSLGLRALMSEKKIAAYPDNTYYRVNISGDCTILPLRIKRKIPPLRRQKKNITRTGFSVEPVGRGEYFGFRLDGDGRFLLGDFTVTHNSNIQLWWANQFIKAGANVIYASLEMSYESVMDRYNAMITGLNSNDIRNKKLSPEHLARYIEGIIADKLEPVVAREFLQKARSTIIDRTNPEYALKLALEYPARKNKFFLLDIPRACSPARISREIRRLGLDTEINVVFIDYLTIMEPNFHSKDRVRELGSLAQDVKEVARSTKTIIVTAAQLNTSGMEEGEKITTDSIKYAKAIGENCDWMMGFHRTKEDFLLRQIRIELAKHRYSASATALLEVDFATMQIVDRGEYEAIDTSGTV